jgi:tyrosinase
MPDEQPTTEASTPPSRYERVKEILDQAAAGAHPSYQGHDRFWNLPLAQFLEVKLYGVRMIAPPVPPPAGAAFPLMAVAPAKSCCHGEAAPTAPAAPSTPVKQPGRGAASGLIIGLKGQPPFDGSQFPRLPWGGSPVAPADIAFIEAWIDAGCPEHDAPRGDAGNRERLHALATGNIAHQLHRGPVNAFRNATGKPKIRKNIECLTPEELQRFRDAIAKMKSLDNYEQDERSFGYWARIHANQCQHSWEQFLTWHRAYLYFFEQQLQDVDPTVTLPYWDWAANREDVEASIAAMGSKVALDNGVVPEAYRCWIDQSGIDRLKAAGVPGPVLDKLGTVVDRKFDSGNRLFIKAGIQWGDDPRSDQAIIDTLSQINPLWHYQRWPGGNSAIIFEAYPRHEDMARILQLDNFFAFGSGPADNHFFGALENVHNLIHNFTGGLNPNYGNSTEPMNTKNPQAGDMVNAGRTAFDPIFWAHHSNVDRLWAEWQKQHPDGGPDDPTDILSPWPMTVKDTFTIADLGYEYMQSAHVFPATCETAITRFVSAPAEANPIAVATHRRAEIRVHRVQYATRAGFFIRVFLNQADANAATPTAGNDHYVGMLNMFTGLCIGGPGHCEPPDAGQRRKFDRRSRHHKTPANFHIDATNTIAKLKEQGAGDFHVTLVVLNIDGTPATDALHIDGVSLDFFD